MVGLLAIYGAARLAFSCFPIDVSGSTLGESGRWHEMRAVAIFADATLAARRLRTDLGNSNVSGQGRWPVIGLGIAMSVCLILTRGIRRSESIHHHFRLVERAFSARTIGLLLVVAVKLVETH